MKWRGYRSLGSVRGIKFLCVITSCDNIGLGYPQNVFNGTIYTNLVPRLNMEYETVASLT